MYQPTKDEMNKSEQIFGIARKTSGDRCNLTVMTCQQQ